MDGDRGVRVAVGVQAIVLNGGSSSGKSSIARALQEILPGIWLTFGTDDFIAALPGRGDSPRSGICYRPDGSVIVGEAFRSAEATYYAGLAAMARAGARLILDEVLLSGGRGQQRMRQALDGLKLFWVGVHCDPAVATAREVGRGDRVGGMAAEQALSVHAGVSYDAEVDTTERPPTASARAIAAHLRN